MTVFDEILAICEKEEKNDVLDEIALKAKNVIMRQKFADEYGIDLGTNAKLAECDHYLKTHYECISWFNDGSNGRLISWPENGKQPVNEWIYSVSTSAYIFGQDYEGPHVEGQKQLYRDFFAELRSYKPDYEDLRNRRLYWKIENASKIYNEFSGIIQKYYARDKQSRRIAQLEKELHDVRRIS